MRFLFFTTFLFLAHALRADEDIATQIVMQLGSSYLNATDEVHGVAFSPDGKQMAALFEDRSSTGRVRIWETTTGRRLQDVVVSRVSKMLQFTPDGKSLLTMSSRFSTKGEKEELPKPKTSHYLIALSGNTAAFRTNTNGECVVFDLATKKERSRFRMKVKTSSIQCAAVSPDEKLVAGATYEGLLELRHVENGEIARALELPQKGMIAEVCFSPDGKLLAVGGYFSSLLVYEVATGKLVHQLRVGSAGLPPVQAIVFTADGKQIATGTRSSGGALFWEVESGKQVGVVKTTLRQINSLAISADQRYLVAGGESVSGATRINLWDLTEQKRLFVPKGPKTTITQIAYSPNTGQIATGTTGGQVHLWNARSGKMLLELSGKATGALTFSNDSWFLGGGDRYGNYQLWETDTGDKLVTRAAELSRRGACIAFSPLMDRVAIGKEDGELVMLDVATGKEIKKFKPYATAPVKCVTFSTDGKRFATASGRNRTGRTSTKDSLEIWDADSYKQIKKLEVPLVVDQRYSTDGVTFIEFSPDGALVAGSHYRGGTFVWDLESRAVIQQLPRGIFRFSTDGKMIAFAEGARIELRELATGGTLLHRMLPSSSASGEKDPFGAPRAGGADPFGTPASSARRVSALQISPDGRSFATSLSPENTVLIWGLAPDGTVDKSDADLTDDDFARLWNSLTQVDAGPAYRSIWQLTAAGNKTVARIAPKLTAASKDKTTAKEQILKWIDKLDDETFLTREEAAQQLLAVGAPAVVHLRTALDASSKESAFRIARLLKIIERPVQRFSGEPLRRIRAIQVLEKIGTREAMEVLEKVATGDPDARETKDAALAHARIKIRISGR